MSINLNTLSAGYKGSSTKIRSSNTRPPIVSNKKVNADDLIEKIKIWHADGILDSIEINKIIQQLQTIV
jgi:hypothetical protein|tara:strand:+ start:139 stop:345 length:207 start_codon:yes stop_codon:yes gene_type:complete